MPAFSFALLRVSYRVCEWIWHCFTGSCSHWVLAAGVHYTVRIRHGGSKGSISGQIVSSSFSCSNYSSFISCYRLLKSQENTLMTPIQQLICSKQLYSHSSEAATRKDVRRHIKRLGLSLNLVMFLCWTVLKTTQSHLSSKAELMGSILAILVNSKL